MTPRGQAPRGAGDTPEATQASFVDPAASMSLLTSLLANPLDAGYVHYRAEHGATMCNHGHTPPCSLPISFTATIVP